MSDHYSIYYIEKIAEERETAARCRLSVKPEGARREARGSAESPRAGLLRTLARAIGFGRPVQAAHGIGPVRR